MIQSHCEYKLGYKLGRKIQVSRGNDSVQSGRDKLAHGILNRPVIKAPGVFSDAVSELKTGPLLLAPLL